MNMVLKMLAGLTALPMLAIGLAWAIMPAKAAEAIKLPLLEGEALGTQIGDGGALFLSIGLMIIAALFTGRRILFQIPAMMFMGIAFLRILAHFVHGADLTMPFVVIEAVSAGILLLAAKRLGSAGA
jgi:hypothetical protein